MQPCTRTSNNQELVQFSCVLTWYKLSILTSNTTVQSLQCRENTEKLKWRKAFFQKMHQSNGLKIQRNMASMQTARSRQPYADSQQQTASSRHPATDSQQQTASRQATPLQVSKRLNDALIKVLLIGQQLRKETSHSAGNASQITATYSDKDMKHYPNIIQEINIASPKMFRKFSRDS